MSSGSREASTTEEIADLFRSQFQSVFVHETITASDIRKATDTVPHLLDLGPLPSFSAREVEDACHKLKKSNNPGPDGIPSVILKKCVASLSLPLAIIFNLSLSEGVFPDIWKRSYVFPVFKKGNKRSVSNYRGIAALCASSKLFEVMVLDYLCHSCCSYISEDQHGFTKKRSTLTNLVLYTDSLTHEMERGYQTDAIYTDFSAAFDKINHQIAVAKLYHLGVQGSCLKWMESYLTSRWMSVKICDHISEPFAVTSGVPQGSHLGPFIFLLYLNDVNFVLRCCKLSFADDFKLYYTIKKPTDALFLQEQLNLFVEWCDTNRMALNASKCSVISFTRKRKPIVFDYKMRSDSLKRETVVKDLGVMLDSKLSYKDHISYVSSKAS